MADIVELPDEMLLFLFTFLGVLELSRLGRTCKTLSWLTSLNSVWRWRFLANNDHILRLKQGTRNPFSVRVLSHRSTQETDANMECVWKRLYHRASHSLSFGVGCPKGPKTCKCESVCAEFVTPSRRRAQNRNEIRFDHFSNAMSIEVWVKLDKRKPDGIIIGCQSESIRSQAWPMYHWQIMHVGPDGCVRGSLEPYKFMKGPPINDGCWHHVAITACRTSQRLLVDGEVASSTNFGIGHEYHRRFMTHSQLGNGVISHGAATPWNADAMPKGHCGWYPFHGMIREVRIWSGMLADSTIRDNMYVQRIDLASNRIPRTKVGGYELLGYWPMNKLASGAWPWQGSLVTCTSHLEETQENRVCLVASCLPQGQRTDWVGKLSGYC